jgi:NADPH2:quinone reductase
MRWIRQYEFGPADVLRYEETADLSPAAGQVRIAVGACGVHVIDTTIRQGKQGGAFALPSLPMTPGREVAGVVDALGEGADPAWLGQRVTAHLGMASGGYASQAVAPAEALLPIPGGLTFPEAVALLGTGRTALGVLELAQLSAADVVLVTAAAGGLGSLFVQAARNAGAKVIAAAGGPAKLKLVEADVHTDYLQPGWAEELPLKPTVVLDGVGGEIGRTALKLLGPGGRIVMFGWSSGSPIELNSMDLFGITAIGALGRSIDMLALAAQALADAAAGKWKPLVGEAFALSDAAGAHRAIETRATVGKTVLIA